MAIPGLPTAPDSPPRRIRPDSYAHFSGPWWWRESWEHRDRNLTALGIAVGATAWRESLEWWSCGCLPRAWGPAASVCSNRGEAVRTGSAPPKARAEEENRCTMSMVPPGLVGISRARRAGLT